VAKTTGQGGGSEALKKRKKIQVDVSGKVFVKATFNNVIVTITDVYGNTISWSSAGKNGFKGSRKSTPFAAQIAAEQAGKAAQDVYNQVSFIGGGFGDPPPLGNLYGEAAISFLLTPYGICYIEG